MSCSLHITYADDVEATSARLEDALSQDEPLVELLLCRSLIDASMLAKVLSRHALTLRTFHVEEIALVDVDTECVDQVYETVLEALANATTIEELVILVARDANYRVARADMLVNAMSCMPRLTHVQFCRVFTSEIALNAAIDALDAIKVLILHYEDEGSVETLDMLTMLVEASFKSLTSIEVAGCPNMFKNEEASVHFCDALLKCDALEYISIIENNLDTSVANAMRNILQESKARRVNIETSQLPVRESNDSVESC